MSIQTKLENFALVTVMKPTFYESNNGVKGNDALFTLDSLRISNFTQEGPTKTAKGGYNGNTILRYGKTMRLEMEDVIGQVAALEALMGIVSKSVSTPSNPVAGEYTTIAAAAQTVWALANYKTIVQASVKMYINGVLDTDATFVVSGTDSNIITVTGGVVTAGQTVTFTFNHSTPTTASYAVTDKFATAKYIEGTTYVIDPVTGTKQWIKISIPMFLPDSLWNMTMEAEGDFGVMSIAGEIQANDCGEFYFLGDELNHNCNYCILHI